MDTVAAEYSAWNPGLESELPREYLPLATVFRDGNVLTGVAKAYELSEYLLAVAVLLFEERELS